MAILLCAYHYFLTLLDLECDRVERGYAFVALALRNKLLKLWQ